MKESSVAAFARGFIAVHGVDCARRLDTVVSAIGLEVEEVDADNFEGALVRAVGMPRGTILVNRAIREPGRKLFTIAHEVGHYVLPDHGDEAGPCGRGDVENFDERIAKREREANLFAAELAMPEEIVRPLMVRDPSFTVIEELAASCGTSLTASAYRLVDRSTHALAVVWSSDGRVRWYHRSQEFRPKIRVEELSLATVAADYFRSGDSPPAGWVQVPADAWLYADAIREGATLREWTRHLPSYDATLTLLHATEFIEARHDYEEPEDGDLDPKEFSLERSRWPSKKG